MDETIERRRESRMTKREHAALAGVSAPTMAAFERGETTLSLAKAFDILRVVGLLDEPKEMGAQERFLRESIERWQMLVTDLPPENPARFPDGFYRADYCFKGELKAITTGDFERMLEKVAHIKYTGWPAFMFMSREETRPREVDGAIESWLAPDHLVPRSFSDAAHCDFWRGVPSGRMFLIRGYQEDGQETFPPATVFDSTLPIWRLGEILLHASHLATHLAKDDPDTLSVKVRVLYSGLRGRQLKSWANPLSGMFLEGRPARSDEVLLEADIPVKKLREDLAGVLVPLVSQLFERFDAESVSYDFVQHEVARLMKGRF
ncbi:helix-turn-helix domain-containing protein [Devosia sp. BK]|nr:helix-turn-helix domain-containing protein [Devosia sp. BK]